MGTCFSKKKGSSPPCASLSPATAAGYVATSSGAPSTLVVVDPSINNHPKSEAVPGELKMKLKKEKRTVPGKQEQIEEEESQVKKEIFIIKHRKSHSQDDRDRDCRCPPPQPADAEGVASAPVTTTTTTTTKACNEVVDDKVAGAAVTATTGMGMRVRTSSCNKEEVDAILIQCGRLSRSSSGKAASSSASCDRGRKYSGSKRSYDFDNCEDEHVTAASDDAKKIENNDCHDADGIAAEKTHHHRQRHRQSSRASPSPQGRRRTPSRERNQQQQQRSSSRERRASRSPGRRSSEQNATCNVNANTCNATAGANNNRPGKMVSVPATISSLVMDKSNNGGEYTTTSTTSIKRISVKRNVGGGGEAVMVGSRSAASPRSQSPARSANVKASNDAQQQQQQPSLSRSSSRKAEHSPCRRNPLSEIDPNSLAYPQAHNNHNSNSSTSRVQNRTKRGTTTEGTEEIVLNHLKPNVEINNNRVMSANCSAKERQQIIGVEEAKAKGQAPAAVASGTDCGKPQTLTRSRSSRRSRDLDMINPETTLLSDPTPSYTRLLLEDIQNFHHHNTSTSTAVVSLPPCVTKACSILEAVADLNSATSSNLSCAFSSRDRKSTPPTATTDQVSMNCSLGANIVRKSIVVESEVVVDDDLMEPSFHKYVTVRRGTGGGGLDMEDQESSSGSNSFVSGSHSQQHHWGFSSSSWEPNSADSTDSWTSRSNTNTNTNTRELGGRKRSDCDGLYQQMQSGGINGRGKLTATTNAKGLPHTISAAAST